MDNLVSWALAHHNTWKKKYLDKKVSVQTSEGTFSDLNCTMITPGTFINAQGVRTQTNHFQFLFNKAEIQFDLTRGAKITAQGQVYEIIIDRNAQTSFDDPELKVITVSAKLCS